MKTRFFLGALPVAGLGLSHFLNWFSKDGGKSRQKLPENIPPAKIENPPPEEIERAKLKAQRLLEEIERAKLKTKQLNEELDYEAILAREKREMRKAEYREVYLESPEWKEARQKVLLKANFICYRWGCGAKATQVHHVKYPKRNSLGKFKRENLKNLRAICEACHKEIHGR